MDIKELLEAYGAWCRADSNNLDCKSPSEMIMRSAPHADASETSPVTRCQADYISDDMALKIDRIVGDLESHNELPSVVLDYAIETDNTKLIHQSVLCEVIKLRFHGNLKPQDIADKLNRDFKKRIFNRINVEKLIERGMGFIEGQLNYVSDNFR